jgi:hypothetical protein
MIPTEPKKTFLESLAPVIAALGGARTPVSQALVEAGFFLALVAGADWVYEHATPSFKPILLIFFMFFGFFISIAVFVRVMTSILGVLPKVNRK